jgi:hypothetical protein
MQVICAVVCRDIRIIDGWVAIVDPNIKLRAPSFPAQVWFQHAVAIQLSSRDRTRSPSFGLLMSILRPDGKVLGGSGGVKLVFDRKRVNDPVVHTVWSLQASTITVPTPGEYTFRVHDRSGHVDIKTRFQVMSDPASRPLEDMPEHHKKFLEDVAAHHPSPSV